MERHGGTIDFDTEVGAAAPHSRYAFPSCVHNPRAARKPTVKHHILFVDDEERVLESLRRMLHPQRRSLGDDVRGPAGGRLGTSPRSRRRCGGHGCQDARHQRPGTARAHAAGGANQGPAGGDADGIGRPRLETPGLGTGRRGLAEQTGRSGRAAGPAAERAPVEVLPGRVEGPQRARWSRRSRSAPWSWPTRGWTSSGGWEKSPSNGTSTRETTWSAWGSTAGRSPKP